MQPSLIIVLLGAICVAANAIESQWRFPSLINATLDDLQRGLNRGCFSSLELVKTYQERIGQVQSQLRAVTEINPDALAIAASLDKERQAGKSRGPLHGVPILLKDNIATMDKMNNTAGSTLLVGAKVPHDSTVAKKLREAGAIILGKTNMDEWADYRSSWIPAGYSPWGGQTYGAYHEVFGPAGSSSGSAVSADIGLALAALGTETSGSVTHPAMRNGVVGIKPTVGLVSRHLVIPASEHRDSIGPLARTVRDAAHLLQAIAGPDPADNYTSAIPGPIPDYVAACDEKALQGARIGVPYNIFAEDMGRFSEDPVYATFMKALKVMEAAGATIVTANFTKPDLDDRSIEEDARLTSAADLIVNLPNYFAQLSENPFKLDTLSSLREKTRNSPAEENDIWGTTVWDHALDEIGFNNTDPRFWSALQRLKQFQGPDGLLGAIERNKVQAVVLPAFYATKTANHIGAPVLTVPLGYDAADTPVNTRTLPNGKLFAWGPGPATPFALSFVGPLWSESILIRLAYAYEQNTHVRSAARHEIEPTAEITVSPSCYS